MAQSKKSVVIVGGGFAGVACAKKLGKAGVKVTLIDKQNYHQFQPLLYQVVTAQVSSADVANSLRTIFRKYKSVDVKMAEVVSVDTDACTVTCADGSQFSGDYLVMATGAQPNFFGVEGASDNSFPLYSVRDARRLRSRVFAAFEDADRDNSLIDRGALNFVIVGGGATGVETAGALSGLINKVLPSRFHDLSLQSAKIYLIDPSQNLLAPFSDTAHKYASRVLRDSGVDLKMGLSVTKVDRLSVTLSDGSVIPTATVVWAGGIKASQLAAETGVAQSRGGRIETNTDLTVAGKPNVYVLGDVAAIPAGDGSAHPQLGSVAMQSGSWAAKNILADIEGQPRQAFHYRDKGIMAMIGRNAAIAELGPKRREVHGFIAFVAWLGVHASLMSGVRERRNALRSWLWDYFTTNRATALIDEPEAARIDWSTGDTEVIDLTETSIK